MELKTRPLAGGSLPGSSGARGCQNGLRHNLPDHSSVACRARVAARNRHRPRALIRLDPTRRAGISARMLGAPALEAESRKGAPREHS